MSGQGSNLFISTAKEFFPSSFVKIRTRELEQYTKYLNPGHTQTQ